MEPILQQHLAEGIMLLRNVMSPEECADLIRKSEERGFEKAKVNIMGVQTLRTDVRDNDRCIFFDFALADLLWQRTRAYLPPEFDGMKASGLNEMFRVYRYWPGQVFQRHRDGRFTRLREQSRVTFLLYLNDDFEGGVTTFRDVQVAPVEGAALCFTHELLHSGDAVSTGVKYALRSDVMYGIQV